MKLHITGRDHDFLQVLVRYLERCGYAVSSDDESSFPWTSPIRADVLIYDLDACSGFSMTFFHRLRETYPHTPLIAMVATEDVKVGVNIIRSGASDCLVKPFLPEELRKSLSVVLEQGRSRWPEHEPASRKKNTDKPVAEGFSDAPGMAALMKQVAVVAGTNFTVLITGESGTGKEAVARGIHRLSSRAEGPFIAVDCGTLSRELAASELFGHRKGSFTGAESDKKGLLELAAGGTFFLDEIGNLSPDVQMKLLRVLQEKKLRPVGAQSDVAVDVRIIAATNGELPDLAKEGRFRMDLYYRLNEFHIQVPPLRERQEDILPFAGYFLRDACIRLEKEPMVLSPGHQEALLSHGWSGNLRELRNVMTRLALLGEEGGRWLYDYVGRTEMPVAIGAADMNQQAVRKPAAAGEWANLREAASRAELDFILRILEKVHFNKSEAARIMNISRRTLYNKLRMM